MLLVARIDIGDRIAPKDDQACVDAEQNPDGDEGNSEWPQAAPLDARLIVGDVTETVQNTVTEVVTVTETVTAP